MAAPAGRSVVFVTGNAKKLEEVRVLSWLYLMLNESNGSNESMRTVDVFDVFDVLGLVTNGLRADLRLLLILLLQTSQGSSPGCRHVCIRI